MKLLNKNTKHVLLFSFVIILCIINAVDVKSQENHTLFIKNNTIYQKIIVYNNGEEEKNITVNGLTSISIPLNDKNNLTIKILNDKNKIIIPEKEYEIADSNTIITLNQDNAYIKTFTFVNWEEYGKGVSSALEYAKGDVAMTIIIIILAVLGAMIIVYFQYKTYYD